MRYGETGVNLEIDLSRGSIEKEESDPRLTELHLGGEGTSARILWDRVPPEVKPFDADNLLIFGPGLLDGTPVPAANRTIISSITPPTYLHTFSMMGGFWGPELKYAGYDRVIIRGKSPSLVYLWIDDDKVEIRDASHLAGKGCLETEELIKEELKQPKAQVAAIGLAGENRVYMSCIEHSRSSASRGGLGVIMGDKKLKAIAVHGTKDVNIARPAELFELCDYQLKRRKQKGRGMSTRAMGEGGGAMAAMEAMGSVGGGAGMVTSHNDSFHTNNFAWGNARQRIKDYWNEDVAKKWKEQTEGWFDRSVSCYNCPDKCGAAMSKPGHQKFFLKCYSKLTYAMAARADLDFDYRMLSLCQGYGLDGYSMPQVLAFALELYEAGILTKQDMAGMPSDTEGAFFWLTERIVRREGIGDVLANGTYWAAQQIGKGAEAYAHNNIKKMEQLPLKLSMINYSFYLMYATGEKMTITQIRGPFPQDPLPTRKMREALVNSEDCSWPERFKQYFVEWEPRTHESIPAAVDICDWSENLHRVDDATGLCAFWGSFGANPTWHQGNIPLLISYATGMDIDEAELLKIARRNRNLGRGINVRLGMKKSDEQIPEDHYKHREPEAEAKLIEEYYKFQGWNEEGIPTRETLDGMGLDYVAEDLERRGILSTLVLAKG